MLLILGHWVSLVVNWGGLKKLGCLDFGDSGYGRGMETSGIVNLVLCIL